MFINEDYTNYKYLVRVSDNYIVLSNVSNATGSYEYPDTIDVIYQYIYPSTLIVDGEETFYRTEYFTNVSSQFETDFMYRADASNIIFTGGLFLFFSLFVISVVTSLARKGGILFD